MDSETAHYPPSVDTAYTDRYSRPKSSSPVKMRNSSFNIPTSSSTQPQEPSLNPPKSFQRKPVAGLGPSASNVSIRSVSSGRNMSIRTVSQNPPTEQDHSTVQPKPLERESSLSAALRQAHTRVVSEPLQAPPTFTTSNYNDPTNPTLQVSDADFPPEESAQYEQLQYHHDWDEPAASDPTPPSKNMRDSVASLGSEPKTVSSGSDNQGLDSSSRPKPHGRTASTHTATVFDHTRGRSLTPLGNSSDPSISPAGRHARSVSAGRSPDSRQSSYVDLLNMSYSQQYAQQQSHTFDNANLRTAVGSNAALLDTRKTIEMYRANVKKTNDPAISYEFALLMISAAQDAAVADQLSDPNSSKSTGPNGLSGSKAQAELLHEARQILQRLADRSYVFAQYYLADGYATGLFNKGKEDPERAFQLFVSAGKHGHAESSYRAALSYEFGWGCRRDYAKAVQFYRQAASKNHPGAACRLGMACLSGDLGNLAGRDREGVKWLKRATESADYQHNTAPYELGILHITGFGDDVFKDEGYAAQLFTQAAELGHPDASLRMGEAYEHGLLTCPKDPALSIHFYTGAAQAGVPKAMMALCAWYMVGAEPVLEKDEREAYEWAKKAAETHYPKAEYAVGYFTEMGIGCRRDPLEANVWYVRAADHGEERAKQRLAIIRAAETGDHQPPKGLKPPKTLGKKKSMTSNGAAEDKDDKDCIVM